MKKPAPKKVESKPKVKAILATSPAVLPLDMQIQQDLKKERDLWKQRWGDLKVQLDVASALVKKLERERDNLHEDYSTAAQNIDMDGLMRELATHRTLANDGTLSDADFRKAIKGT